MTVLKYGVTLLFIFSNFILVDKLYALGVNLSGNLVVTPPECILNGGKQQIVRFNDVLLTRIDGINYQQNIELKLTCSELATNLIKLTFVGEKADFNNDSLVTSNKKLGIAFYVNDSRQAINEPFNVDYNILPMIKVAPVRDLDADYKNTDGGYFTALATLKVDYQ